VLSGAQEAASIGVQLTRDWADGNGNTYRAGQTVFVDQATADTLTAHTLLDATPSTRKTPVVTE
jgi:hypothetical protein